MFDLMCGSGSLFFAGTMRISHDLFCSFVKIFVHVFLIICKLTFFVSILEIKADQDVVPAYVYVAIAIVAIMVLSLCVGAVFRL